MAQVGDRIAVSSKGQPRSGVVTAVSGAMITVRWDTGGETSLIPGPGVLSVLTSRRRTLPARTRPTTSGAKAAAGKTPVVKKPTPKKVAPRKKAAAGKTPVAKKPMAKKVAPRSEPMAKGTSSSRTTGKKAR